MRTMFFMNSQGVRKARSAPRGSVRATRRIARASAFTLVELLVVIAIIAILISLLLPSLRGVADASRLVTCRSNLRRIVSAALAYGQDRNGQLPDQIAWHNPGNRTGYSIAPYLDLPRSGTPQTPVDTHYDTVLTCPGARFFPGPVAPNSWLNAYNLSYALNGHLPGSNIGRRNQPEHLYYWPTLSIVVHAPYFIHRIRSPSETGFFFDSVTSRGVHLPPGFPRPYKNHDGARWVAFRRTHREQHYYIHRFRGNRNRDQEWTHDEDVINVGYVDGRAEAVTRLTMEAHAINWQSKAFWGQ